MEYRALYFRMITMVVAKQVTNNSGTIFYAKLSDRSLVDVFTGRQNQLNHLGLFYYHVNYIWPSKISANRTPFRIHIYWMNNMNVEDRFSTIQYGSIGRSVFVWPIDKQYWFRLLIITRFTHSTLHRFTKLATHDGMS